MTAARDDCNWTVLTDVIRFLLWCGHALHLQRTTREHFDRRRAEQYRRWWMLSGTTILIEW